MSYMSISGFFANAACGARRGGGPPSPHRAHPSAPPVRGGRGGMSVLGLGQNPGVGQNDGFGLQARRRKVLKAECTCCT